MKLAVSFVIRGVVEFPIDVRPPSGLEASFFPLVLGITCLYEHRSTGGNFTRIGQSIDWVVRTPPSRHRAFQTFVLENYLVIAEAAFHVEYYSTLISAR